MSWIQERYLELGEGESAFAFRGITPGRKRVAARLESVDAHVRFAGVECEVAAGETADVGLMAPFSGARVELRLALRDHVGEAVAMKELSGPSGPPTFRVYVSSIGNVPHTRDITDEVRFDETGRVTLHGLPESTFSVMRLDVRGAPSPLICKAPFIVPFCTPDDEVVDVPVRVSPAVPLLLEIPVVADTVDELTSVLVSECGFGKKRLMCVRRPSDAVFLGAGLALGGWKIRGSLVSGDRGWVFEQRVEVTAGGPCEARAHVEPAAWIEGVMTSEEKEVGVWLAPEELAAADVWPYWGAVDERRFRVAVPAHTRLAVRFRETKVTSGAAGETVNVKLP